MQLKLILMRCGAIEVALQDKLIGITDCPLDEKGMREIKEQRESGLIPPASQLYCSSLQRCLQTAKLAYPEVEPVVLNRLGAMDYGVFEGKTRHDVEQDERFIQWAGENGARAYPGGESPYDFSARCLAAFQYIVGEMSSEGVEDAAIITHRLVINTILQRFCEPRSQYHNYRIRHGGGCVAQFHTASTSLVIERYF